MRWTVADMEDPAALGARRSTLGQFREERGYRVRRSGGRPDWLLVQTVTGCGVFRRSAQEVLAPAGTISLVPPGVEHDYGVAPDHEDWSLIWAHVFPRSEWLALLDWPATSAPGIRQVQLGGEQHEGVARAFSAAAQAWRGHGPLAEAFALNGLERALLLVAEARRDVAPGDARIEAVLAHVEANLSEDLSVSALARVAGLSPSWFARTFSERVGTPPQRHVEHQRMSLAAQLLDITDRPVASIARAVGFADPLYFSTRFRRVVGLNPTEFRGRHRSVDVPATTDLRASTGAGSPDDRDRDQLRGR